jgi:hypothetical protein
VATVIDGKNIGEEQRMRRIKLPQRIDIVIKMA